MATVAAPAHESTLPPVLFVEHLAALLGTSPRTIRRARRRRDWPFTELTGVDRKPRWSRDQVLTILSAKRTR